MRRVSNSSHKVIYLRLQCINVAKLCAFAFPVEAGIIEESELETFKQDGSRLGGHPSLNGLPGIEFASGSLGQGLSLGVGTCLAL